jgi:manganese/zinc/iron transport system permease protein
MLVVVVYCSLTFSSSCVWGQAHDHGADGQRHKPTQGSLARSSFKLPTGEELVNVLLLRDYNTRVVTFGTILLGITAGLIGVFMLLRKRSLVGDVVSHSALPGIAMAYLIAESVGQSGRSLPVLMIGATIAGFLGVVCTVGIRRYTRVKEDAALALVLSVFFGFGVALFTLIQSLPTGNSAGLNHFIYGNTATMIASDVYVIVIASVVVWISGFFLFKEFKLLCFDQRFAASQGWPVTALDLLLMALVVAVTVIGMQSVGLLLVVAMLIIPAAAARFWSDRLERVALLACALGGLASYFGVILSALFPNLAAGAVIVLTGTAFFVISLLFGWRRGMLQRIWMQMRVRYRVQQHHLLRAVYEVLELVQIESIAEQDESSLIELKQAVSLGQLKQHRAWSKSELARSIHYARRDDLVVDIGSDPNVVRLTKTGRAAARRVVRNHRMWELYLINFADIAPSHVDRDADLIEHVLEPEMIEQLEEIMEQASATMRVPPSPHDVTTEPPNSEGPQ